MNKTRILFSGFISALILGVSGSTLVYIGPSILNPEANRSSMPRVLIAGLIGSLLGGLIGFGTGMLRQYYETRRTHSVLQSAPKIWNWILWGSTILAITVIIAGIFYIPWHQKKYSHIVNDNFDLRNRDKSLTSLSVRFLYDDELIQLQQFIHLNYIDFQKGFDLGDARLTDSGLKNLSELHLPNLKQLTLGYCYKITDNGIQYVAEIKNLQYLSLSACPQITDDGLLKLNSLAALETLDLRGSYGITDRGLGYLKGIPKLKEVMLGGCINVTAAGMDDLRKALPNCKVTKDDKEWTSNTKQ